MKSLIVLFSEELKDTPAIQAALLQWRTLLVKLFAAGMQGSSLKDGLVN
jgi:hypothetical protein